MNIRIEEPSTQYKKSYLEALEEFHGEDRNIFIDPEIVAEDFKAFIKNFFDRKNGIGLGKKFVPQTTFWIIDADGYAGRVSLNHYLNEKLEKVGGHIGYEVRPSKRGRGYASEALMFILAKAKSMGLERVLLTCNSRNIASKKIIESQGGVLENEVEVGEGKSNILRYWILL